MEIKKKVAFKTLGCRLNQFESGSLATKFKTAGYKLVNFDEDADVYIVNTCTVTNQSDHKSRNIISQASRRGKNPLVVVTGCMAESSKEWLLKDKNVSYVVGNDNKSDVFSVVDSHFKGEVFSLNENRNVFNFLNPQKIFKTRGTVKIQDGCDNYCTFCIIPFVRGKAISRPMNDILSNIQDLIEYGYREIVITGVNIGRYHFENNCFEDLIEKTLELPGDFRLRISSMEPEGIGSKFLSLIDHPKMSPHLHICLQSGSDKILLKMRRMYDVQKYLSLIEKIKVRKELFNFTTDILVGFPGETDQDFKDTLKVIHEVRFGHIHTFKYSLRDGTRASRMDDHISDKIKNERSSVVRQLSEQYKIKYRQKLIGHTQKVLVEKQRKDGFLIGYGENYIPVKWEGEKNRIDFFENVRLKEIDPLDHTVIAELEN